MAGGAANRMDMRDYRRIVALVPGHEATLNHRVRYLEPSTHGREYGVQDLVPAFDRGAAMPYVERNSCKVQTMPNPEAWLQPQTE